MNFQTKPVLTPVTVLVVNPLTAAGQLTIFKILSGMVFGKDQLVDMILLVYSNEKPAAEVFRLQLLGCAYPCYNRIIVSSDLPSVSDAEVFCFISNFSELNKIDVEKIDSDEQQFDAMYLIIKVANNLSGTICAKVSDDTKLSLKQKSKEVKHIPRKPIIMADGLVALDILMSMSKNMPTDVFFCPTGIVEVSKSVLAEFLKVECNVINDVFVWAANDEVLHVEVEKPVIIHDNIKSKNDCDWTMISEDLLQSMEYDHTQINSSWMKKEFIQKVTSVTSKNPYGCIYKASAFCNALKAIWDCRKYNTGKSFYHNLGVISDGSLGTIKGYPYVLPLVLCRNTWNVNKIFEEDVHVKNEIKRMNKTVRKQHQLLIPYCKRFLQENVVNQAFIPPSESNTCYSIQSSSKSSF